MSYGVPYNFDPTEFRKQAASYSGSVSGVVSSLDQALTNLNNVNSKIGLDPRGNNDLLSINIISGCEEIKGEVSELKGDLGKYSSLIQSKAYDLDMEAKRQYDIALARYRAMQAKKENKETTK